MVADRVAGAARSGFGVDRAYGAAVIAPFRGLAALLDAGSESIVQRSADGIGGLLYRAGGLVRRTQGGYVRVYEAMLLAGAIVLLVFWSLR